MANAENELKILLENPVLIYGAGRGTAVVRDMKHLTMNIIGVAVTEISEKTPSDIEGYKVNTIESYKEYANTAVVLILTGENHHDSIKENCQKNGFKNVIVRSLELLGAISELSYKESFIKHNISLNEEVISIGGGNYLNPFTNALPCELGILESFGDFIFPSVFNDFSMEYVGNYEYGEVKLNSGDIVLDLGANVGYFSVLAASKGCTAYAFEPTPERKAIIQRHSQLNAHKIFYMPYAISNKCGEAVFHVNSASQSANCFVDGDIDENSGSIKVPTITVDEFVRQEGLERVDFIKSCVMTNVYEFLEGTTNTLKKFSPKISMFIELYDNDISDLENLIRETNPNYKIEYKWKKLYAHV